MFRVVLLVLLYIPLAVSAETLININTASQEELETLPGIGSVYAGRIIEYRTNTPFETIEDIQNVSGIGSATFAKIEPHITVEAKEESSVVSDEEDVVSGSVGRTQHKNVDGVHIRSPEYTFVNQKTVFRAVPYPEDTGRLVRYEWNFGDLTMDTGLETEHRFAFAGEYSVLLSGTFKGDDFSVRKNIVVLPPMFSITRSAEGDIQIHNDSVESVDMSNFVLKSTGEINIPEGTVALPYATVTVSQEKIEKGGVRGIPRLYDSVGTLVATYDSNTVSVEENVPEPISQVVSVAAVVEEKESNIAYIGLLAVLSVGILGVYTRRRESPYIEDIEKSI